jgi:cell wall-associated NlpC family hydrolase
VRVRTLSAFLGSLIVMAAPASSALADTGGAAAGGATPPVGLIPDTSGGAATGSVTGKPTPHLSPITARSPRLAYKGPVFEKTATGQVVPYQPPLPVAQIIPTTGGSPVGVAAAVATKPLLLVPGSLARYVNGLAAAPMSAPAAVQQVIWAANQIIGLPYIFGGGHASFESPGYDCSGAVSFALHGGNLLATPEDSSEFMAWGSHGAGRWLAIFSNPGHAYMDVAGLRLDTSAADDPSNQQGPRWRPLRAANEGYTLRHPLGL